MTCAYRKVGNRIEQCGYEKILADDGLPTRTVSTPRSTMPTTKPPKSRKTLPLLRLHQRYYPPSRSRTPLRFSHENPLSTLLLIIFLFIILIFFIVILSVLVAFFVPTVVFFVVLLGFLSSL